MHPAPVPWSLSQTSASGTGAGGATDADATNGGDPDDGAWVPRAFAPAALGGAYQLVRVLGRGGMGVVVLARERALHRAVAVKFVRPALAASPRAVERFAREARIQAQLEHPGIVPLYASGATWVVDAGDVPLPYL